MSENSAIEKPPGQSWWLFYYARRHWRGELSLLKSFWINCVLVWVGLFIALGFIQPMMSRDFTNNHLLWSVIAVMGWILGLILGTWQLVGTWRAAEMLARTPGRYGRAVTCQVLMAMFGLALFGNFVLSGITSIRTYALIFFESTQEEQRAALHLLRNNTELEIVGPVYFGLTKKLRAALDAHPGIRVLHLTSSGGSASEARAAYELVKSRKLTTHVAARCASACVLIYLGGENRIARETAKFGFHRAAPLVQLPGVIEKTDIDPLQESDADQAIFLASGISANFVVRAFTTPNKDIWEPSFDELISAGVVQRAARDDEVSVSGIYGQNIADLEKALLAVTLFATIKERHPDVYEVLSDIIAEAAAEGLTYIEMRERVLPQVEPLILQSLPLAADDVLQDFARLFVAQAQALMAKDPEQCRNMLLSNMAYTMHLPAQLMADELALDNRVLQTADPEATVRFAAVEDAATMDMVALYNKLTEQTSPDIIDVLASGEFDKVDAKKLCTAIVKLYEMALELPPDRASNALRLMFASAEGEIADDGINLTDDIEPFLMEEESRE